MQVLWEQKGEVDNKCKDRFLFFFSKNHLQIMLQRKLWTGEFLEMWQSEGKNSKERSSFHRTLEISWCWQWIEFLYCEYLYFCFGLC